MSDMVKWDSEAKNFIIAEFDTQWAWEDFYAAFRQMHQLISEVEYRVDIIIWHKVKLPKGSPFSHFKAAMKDQPSNTGNVIIIPNESSAVQSFLTSLASIFERLFPSKSKVIMVNSLQEAKEKVTMPERMSQDSKGQVIP